MAYLRMCRWHNGQECPDPDFEHIKSNGFSLLRCRECGDSPPIEGLIPKLADEWPPNPLPEDEKVGRMDLHWPESVFGKRHRAAKQSIPAAIEIKQSVHILIDGEKETFQMVDEEPLDSSQLRLMRLAPVAGDEAVCVSLQTYQDQNMPEYEAVSYSLGGENRKRTPNKPIYIGKHGDIMLLTETCEAMLRFLSPQPGEPSKLLWFDYLCINQHDMTERDCQLPKMRSVYGLCTRVIVYLGDDIVQRLNSGQHRSRHWLDKIDRVLQCDEDLKWLTFKDVLKRDYFKRTWIIQEILLAETIVIPIGRYDFRAGMVALNRLKELTNWDWSATDAPWLQRMGEASIYRNDLREALQQTWQSRVTDPRDKVNGILGLVEFDPEFAPNSTLSWFATFIGTCAHLIKRGHTELLLRQPMDPGKSPKKLTWLPEWSVSSIWDRPSKHLLRFLEHIRKQYHFTTLGEPKFLEEGYQKRAYRMDIICLRPEKSVDRSDSPELRLVPMLEFLSLCRSTGALCLKLGHLLTLTATPVLSHEADLLRVFKIGNKNGYIVISTLNGDLAALQSSDEIYLHIGTYNQLGILFALRQQEKTHHKVVLICTLVDVLLFTKREPSLLKDCSPGVPLYPSNEPFEFVNIGHLQWYRSSFGKSLSSLLREAREDTHSKSPEDKYYMDEFYRTEEPSFYSVSKIETERGEIQVFIRIAGTQVLSVSQSIINDEAEPDKNTKRRPYFYTAFENSLRDLLPEYSITINDSRLAIQLPRGRQLAWEKHPKSDLQVVHLGLPGFHGRIRHDRSPDTPFRELFPLPDELRFDLNKVRQTIVERGRFYSRLRSLVGFRRQTGLNETQLLQQCNDIPSEYDSIYPDFEWPCVQSIVDNIGLVGEVKEVRIL